MASQTLTGTILDPTGVAAASGTVVTLTPYLSSGLPGALSFGSTTVAAPVSVSTDGNGYITFPSVRANSECTNDPNSYYHVTVDSLHFHSTWYIQVPAAGGPFDIQSASVLFSPPPTVPGVRSPTGDTYGATIYYDPSGARGGNDSQDGFHQPIKTIARAMAIADASLGANEPVRVVVLNGPTFDPTAAPGTWPPGAQAEALTATFQPSRRGLCIETETRTLPKVAMAHSDTASGSLVNQLFYNGGGFPATNPIFSPIGWHHRYSGISVRNSATGGDGFDVGDTQAQARDWIMENCLAVGCTRHGWVIHGDITDNLQTNNCFSVFNGTGATTGAGLCFLNSGSAFPNALDWRGGGFNGNGNRTAGTGTQIFANPGTSNITEGWCIQFTNTTFHYSPILSCKGGLKKALFTGCYFEPDNFSNGQTGRSMFEFTVPASGSSKQYWADGITIVDSVINQIDAPGGPGAGTWAANIGLIATLDYVRRFRLYQCSFNGPPGATNPWAGVAGASPTHPGPNATNPLFVATANSERCMVDFRDFSPNDATPLADYDFGPASANGLTPATLYSDLGTDNMWKFHGAF